MTQIIDVEAEEAARKLGRIAIDLEVSEEERGVRESYVTGREHSIIWAEFGAGSDADDTAEDVDFDGDAMLDRVAYDAWLEAQIDD